MRKSVRNPQKAIISQTLRIFVAGSCAISLHSMNSLVRCLIILVLGTAAAVSAQNNTVKPPAVSKKLPQKTTKKTVKPPKAKPVTAQRDSIIKDSLRRVQDSSSAAALLPARDSTVRTLAITTSDSTIKQPRQSLDTIVTYSARDSATFTLSSKKMRLRGDANIKMKDQKLEAEIIEMAFADAGLSAEGTRDSTGRLHGFPKFIDGREEFAGERLSFNLRTKQGVITQGETNVEGGFYYGAKVKRMDERTFFIKDGAYTTCDKPHPHFYFGSPEMKVIANDRIFFDPLIMYVEDLPVFILPIGLYFENRSGRQSGLVVPTFHFSNVNGVVFQNLGYYFALSDYYDTQFGIDIFTKSGYLLRNTTRYVLRDVLNGNFTLSFGRRRSTPDDPMLNSWQSSLYHTQKIDPQTSLTANLSFSSQDFNRDYSTDITQRLQQQIYSNASFTTGFDNGSTLSASFSRSQNLITDESQTTPSISYTLPQMFPLKSFVASDSWLRDVGLSYGVTGDYSLSRNRKITVDTVAKTADTAFVSNERYFTIHHTPSLSISPKFGNFSVTPSFNYRENWYFRKLNRVRHLDSTYSDNMEYSASPLREYQYDMGVSVGTRLFGIIQPNILGINALRHTFQPTFGYRYTPEFSSKTAGYIGSYLDSVTGKQVEYSRYEKDGGASSGKASQLLTYSFANSFEAKIAQNDTSPDLKLDLLRLNLSGNYDFEKDSMPFSDISADFRTPALDFINFNGFAGFTLYNEAPVFDSLAGKVIDRRIDQFLASAGKGLARLTNFSLNFSTRFSSEGAQLTTNQNVADTAAKTPPGVGERFAARANFKETEDDLYGDDTPGWSALSMPWNVAFGATFTYSAPLASQVSRRFDINGTFGLQITPTWNMTGQFSYDVTTNYLFIQSINITKDLHCWNLVFNWIPMGANQGFYLRFGIKASQLQDLKVEKRSNPVYR